MPCSAGFNHLATGASLLHLLGKCCGQSSGSHSHRVFLLSANNARGGPTFPGYQQVYVVSKTAALQACKTINAGIKRSPLDTNSVAGFRLSNFNTSRAQLLNTTENKCVEYFIRIQTPRCSSCVHISSVYSWCGSAFCFNGGF